MTDIAQAAVDAGADVVFGHGPHLSLPVELYKGKPIFYGLGSFSFHTGHNGRKHGDWVGELPSITFSNNEITDIRFKLIRHNEFNETYTCDLKNERETLDFLIAKSAYKNCHLTVEDQEILIKVI
jgi:poly-gamma-glutamate synthesis protein (capsule biosynthesis protein)